MKFSLHSVHGGVKNIDEIHKRAVRAEELGYHGIFLGESHLSSIDSFQTLASCAMITNRVLLGIAVTNMVFRHPTVLAGAAASLNEISKGRAILGLGTGDGPVYSQGLKATPMREFEAGVRMIRELVQGKAIQFPTGKVGISFNLRPPPIYVSAEGPKGLQLAGRSADVSSSAPVSISASTNGRNRTFEMGQPRRNAMQVISQSSLPACSACAKTALK